MERDKFGRFLRGSNYSMSQKHKDKIAKALKGNKHGFKKGNIIQKGISRTIKTKEKMSESHKGLLVGDKNPNWKGGYSNIVERVRQMPEYKLWREAVFKRDNCKCKICEMRSSKIKRVELNAHHIIELSRIVKKNKINTIINARNCSELWNLNNGLTLCIKCHKKTKGK